MTLSDGDSKPVDIHYLSKCVLKGSAIIHAVCGHFRPASTLEIVFGKETTIELVRINEDGILESISEQPVFGIIKDLNVLRRNEKHLTNTKAIDLLVILSDSGKLSFLTFSMKMHRFYAVTHIQLSKPGNMRHQLGRMLATDSGGNFVAVSAYEDWLALFPLSFSADNNIIYKKILYPPENERDTYDGRDAQRNISGTIWSMCFLRECCKQLAHEYCVVLAVILHRKNAALNELLLLGCDSKNHTVHVISEYSEPGPLALSIVEVSHIPGFAVLFRHGDFLLMDLRESSAKCVYRVDLALYVAIRDQVSTDVQGRIIDADDEGIFNVAASALLELRDSGLSANDCGVVSPMKFICSSCWELSNSSSSKLMFSLNSGEIFILELSLDILDGIKVNLSECLFRGLPCKALLWVNEGFVAAIVEMGDGLVLKYECGKMFCKSSIDNIAPILDFSIVDFDDQGESQMYACCGVSPSGSLRIVHSGIAMEKLLGTAPVYPGITGMWTLRMKESDAYHSFLVLSFVEETRVLTVGLNFVDVSDAIGFDLGVCTLATGAWADGMLVQIHACAVKLCLPTTAAHAEGVNLSAPFTTTWAPGNVRISLGAVGYHSIIVATSNPCSLFILAVHPSSACSYEICEIQHVKLQFELSCICILNLDDTKGTASALNGGKIFAVGSHKPSVEILHFVPDMGLKALALGSISLLNTMGNAVSGCIPQDIKLILTDCLYVLVGLRNGMLLRFECTTSSQMLQQVVTGHGSPTDSCHSNINPSLSGTKVALIGLPALFDKDSTPLNLDLVASRRIGVSPVFLVPLHDSPKADVIVLSDKPWLLHTARQSLVYTSIALQSATHATPVYSNECPKGILFAYESCLHLVELANKRLNVQKVFLGGTPRKVLSCKENGLLLVMRTELMDARSDICSVDPLNGSYRSLYIFEDGETPKCMQLVQIVNVPVLVIGTTQSIGRAMMPSGEAESAKGRLLVFVLQCRQNTDDRSVVLESMPGSSSSHFHETVGYSTEQLSISTRSSSVADKNSSSDPQLANIDALQLHLVSDNTLPGMVLALSSYLNGYLLASAGNNLYMYGIAGKNFRLKRLASVKTRFTITCLTTFFTTIAVGDCRDGVLFYSYHEKLRKLEQLYCDPMQRLVADCALTHMNIAAVSDRKGGLCILSRPRDVDENVSAECNLFPACSYYIGEIAMSIKRGSFSYKLPVDDMLEGTYEAETISFFPRASVVASTLLGSVLVFIPISREEHKLLEAVQTKLASHPLTAPLFGNDHTEFRGRGSQSGRPKMLDGDLLAQFLELTTLQQETVLSYNSSGMGNSKFRTPVDQIVRLLERIIYSLS